MLCPLCQAPTRLTNSKGVAPGLIEHTRICMRPSGHVAIPFATVEVLSGVLNHLGSMKLAVNLQTSIRGEQARSKTAQRRAVVRDLHAKGWSATRIAGEIETTPSRVRQYLAEIKPRDATLGA